MSIMEATPVGALPSTTFASASATSTTSLGGAATTSSLSSSSAASSSHDKSVIDFASLDISALEKYQHAFRVQTKRVRPTMQELTRAVADHYRQANLVDGEETEQELLTHFVWRVRGDRHPSHVSVSIRIVPPAPAMNTGLLRSKHT
ncbi:hypothetical protein BC938DRAFT_476580 [Jimgerdemannia flammicorona]|uniref:Histone deacetylase complex subunit SAP30 Sin3 binding domain-containing protein n=1 Tax=Jimgerdemannia flammicorona TaxID=994334 RepID=A0A433QQF4_9FUNG|nr:hypothetical protein BC938DRAFT_476580 [Jimgerdemannia flammicorona]